jgi:HPt (histidine-containing phosphotransfer) domain-containing protein
MSKLVDFDRLQSFTDGDKVLEAELTTLFTQTAEHYLAGLAAAVDDHAAWRSFAHSLKGASSNIGAVEMAQLSAMAERTPPSQTGLEALQASFAATRHCLEQHQQPTGVPTVSMKVQQEPSSLARAAG